MIKIKDIARLANVSQSTVSKALNGRPDIGEVTRKRITEIAKHYNFSPNAIGRGLKNQTTENVGVIFCRDLQPLSGNPFYSRVLEGIEAELAYNNYNLVLQLIPKNSMDNVPKMVRERNVDGLILVGAYREWFIEQMASVQLPLVLIDPKIEFQKCNQVLIDNEQGAFVATQYLISLGHKRIGFISGDLATLSFKSRYMGYVKALKYNGLSVDEKLLATGGVEKGYEQVKSLITLEDKPTAIFAANDINAIYGYKAISDLGLNVPDDISIAGFDDIELAKMCTPPLTTVRVYKEELGSIAVRRLLKILNKEVQEPLTSVIPIKLIQRESTKQLKNST